MRRASLFAFVLAFTALSLASSHTIEGEIVLPPGIHLSPNANSDIINNQDVSVTLNGGEYSTMVRMRGRFTFYDIPTGTYLLEVTCSYAIFEPVCYQYITLLLHPLSSCAI